MNLKRFLVIYFLNFFVTAGSVALIGHAHATTAAPAHVTSPLTCTRNFFVSPAGTDTPGCGAGPLGAAANCKTPWGASTNITGLTGGDCVNVQGTAATQTQFGSSGWTNYDAGAGVTWSTSGSGPNGATGYINYVCSVNHGCKLTGSQPNGFAGFCLAGNFIALDGFEIDGVNVQGFAGYSPSNNHTYNSGGQLWCQAGGHHHMHLNGIYHSAGGGVLGSITGGGTAGDYEYTVATELYDFSANNGSHTSGYNYFEMVGLTPVGGNLWDNDPFHIQAIGNVIHDGGETVAITTGHTDGEGIIIDTWGHVPQYPYGLLIAYNEIYNVGGRGIEVFAGSNLSTYAATITNNTIWNSDMDLGAGGAGLDDGCSFHNTWQNNISYVKNGDIAAGWFSAPSSGCNAGVSNSTWANNLTFNGTVGQASVSSDNGNTISATTNKLGVDPKLTNVTAAIPDLHPLAGSPVIGTGAATPTSRIFTFMTPDGLAPPATPNIGAFNPVSSSIPISINAGGPAVGNFVADIGSTGGTQSLSNPTLPVDTSLVANPAPILVYRSERYGTFNYAVSNLQAGHGYVVNLHFTEDFDTAALQRLFDVTINGTTVLSSFDIFAATGAQHKAIVKAFNVNADVNGLITVAFAPHAGSPDANAKVDGVEFLNSGTIPPPPLPGNFGYTAGRWYVLDLPIPASVAPIAHQANIIRCAPVGQRAIATFNMVAVRIYNADVAGHVAFGIYGNGSDNRPANLVASSASMATTPAGTEPTAALNANVQGGPGGGTVTDKFWVCSNTDSATASFASVSSTGGLPPTLIGTSTPANILQLSGTGTVISHISCAGTACTGGTSTFASGFPASLTGSTWTEQTSTLMPMMAVQFLSVP